MPRSWRPLTASSAGVSSERCGGRPLAPLPAWDGMCIAPPSAPRLGKNLGIGLAQANNSGANAVPSQQAKQHVTPMPGQSARILPGGGQPIFLSRETSAEALLIANGLATASAADSPLLAPASSSAPCAGRERRAIKKPWRASLAHCARGLPPGRQGSPFGRPPAGLDCPVFRVP